MRIVVCAATGTEARACARGIRAAGRSREFEVLLTGMGMERAGHALEARLSEGEKPELVISAGFAGSWSPELAVHDWIVAHELVDMERERVLFSPELAGARAARLLTVRELIDPPIPSRVPAPEEGVPLVVDMESRTLAEVARWHELGFAVVRMITDTPASPLPSFVASFTSAILAERWSSRAALGARGLRQLASQPAGFARFVREGAGWARALEAGWARSADQLLESWNRLQR